MSKAIMLKSESEFIRKTGRVYVIGPDVEISDEPTAFYNYIKNLTGFEIFVGVFGENISSLGYFMPGFIGYNGTVFACRRNAGNWASNTHPYIRLGQRFYIYEIV